MSRRLLQFGLAFVLMYAAIGGFVDPASWVGFFPAFVRVLLPDATALALFGAGEIALAGWILSGYAPRFAGAAAGALFLGIVVFNIPQMDIVFRDLGLAAAALAYAFLPKQ